MLTFISDVFARVPAWMWTCVLSFVALDLLVLGVIVLAKARRERRSIDQFADRADQLQASLKATHPIAETRATFASVEDAILAAKADDLVFLENILLGEMSRRFRWSERLLPLLTLVLHPIKRRRPVVKPPIAPRTRAYCPTCFGPLRSLLDACAKPACLRVQTAEEKHREWSDDQ
jgi:hypothetical protein